VAVPVVVGVVAVVVVVPMLVAMPAIPVTMLVAMPAMPITMPIAIVIGIPAATNGNGMPRMPAVANGNGMSGAPAMVDGDGMSGAPVAMDHDGTAGLATDDGRMSGLVADYDGVARRAVVVPAEPGTIVDPSGQVLLGARRGRCRARQKRNARRCESGAGKRNPLKRFPRLFSSVLGFSAARFMTARLGG
jgi:hypothetical protein